MYLRPRLAAVLLALIFAGSCASRSSVPAGPDGASPSSPQTSLPRGTLEISRERLLLRLKVDVARTDRVRSKGLMFVRSLPRDSGMAFVWSAPVIGSFYMLNTYIPLDIAFWNDQMRITEVFRMEPCRKQPCRLYTPQNPYVGAVEVNAGVLARKKIRPGDSVKLRARSA